MTIGRDVNWKVPENIVVVVVTVIGVIQSIRNNKSDVSILIEFPWCSAIIGLLSLLLLLITHLQCSSACFVFVTCHKNE